MLCYDPLVLLKPFSGVWCFFFFFLASEQPSSFGPQALTRHLRFRGWLGFQSCRSPATGPAPERGPRGPA